MSRRREPLADLQEAYRLARNLASRIPSRGNLRAERRARRAYVQALYKERRRNA